MENVKHVLTLKNDLGEGPLWAPEEQALYWVNITGQTINRLDPASTAREVYNVGVQVGVMARRAQGGFVLATQKGFAFWQRGGMPEFFANPEAGVSDSRFNDGAVDPGGRFWAGTLNERRAPTSCLYRLDADLSVHVMVRELITPNGTGWSPDEHTLYYTDSRRRTIYASDFDTASGTLSNTRPLVVVAENDGVPDGLAVDSEGCLWSARWNGWRVVRYTPDGQIERQIHLPVQCPSSCVFGGENLDELYITSARSALNEQQRREQPLSGDLFRYHPGVRGMEQRRFAG